METPNTPSGGEQTPQILRRKELELASMFLQTVEEHPETFGDTNIITIETNTYKGQSCNRTDLKGLDIAMELIGENPKEKIILLSFLNEDIYIEKLGKGNKLNMLLKQKNVKFAQLPISPEDLTNLANTNEIKTTNSQETEKSFKKILESEIVRFFHSEVHKNEELNKLYKTGGYPKAIEYLQEDDNKKSEKFIAFENRLIGLLQLQHPEHKDKSRIQKLEEIIKLYKWIAAKDAPEGTSYEGVFCDRDGTLYDNTTQTFNQSVLQKLKDYESEGKNITIRTMGDVEKKQNIINEAGLAYTIQNKRDFKGATAEIVIDDESEEVFNINTHIKAQKYIQI